MRRVQVWTDGPPQDLSTVDFDATLDGDPAGAVAEVEAGRRTRREAVAADAEREQR